MQSASPELGPKQPMVSTSGPPRSGHSSRRCSSVSPGNCTIERVERLSSSTDDIVKRFRTCQGVKCANSKYSFVVEPFRRD